MKKTISLLALITGSALYSATAQVNVSINIGTQPVWGPIGYDYAEYYYMPDIETYYYVPKRQFIYLQGKNWIVASSLPAVYANFDLYRGYKVVINEPRPYIHHEVYYKKYYHYRGRKDQAYIRDCHDEKYWVIKDHPEHGKWKHDDDHHDNGNGHGNGNGNGNGNGHGNGKNKH